MRILNSILWDLKSKTAAPALSTEFQENNDGPGGLVILGKTKVLNSNVKYLKMSIGLSS